MSTLFNRLREGFCDKEYRDAYAESFSDSKIATQIKVLREQRGWTQQQLAEAAGMKQSRIATLEDVNYSSWSLRTLRRLAQAFDVWLDVDFREFSALWTELRDFSQASLARCPFTEDPVFSATTGVTRITIPAMPGVLLNEGGTISGQSTSLYAVTTGGLSTGSIRGRAVISSGNVVISSGNVVISNVIAPHMPMTEESDTTATFRQVPWDSGRSLDPVYWQEPVVA